jgi:hypothetical protein
MEPQTCVRNKWGWNNIHIYTDERTNGNAIPQVWGRACAIPYADFWRFVVVTDVVTDVGSALTAN